MRLTLPEQLTAAIRDHRQLFMGTVVALSVGIWTAVGTSLWFARSVVTDLPGTAALRDIRSMAQATTLIDVKGRHAFTIFQEQRLEVPLSRVSPHFVRAILAVEDQRFYDHGGVDVVRVAGAAWNNLLARRAEQGGSTLTQQLARQSFLTADKTFRRKLKEVFLAARLEKEFSKNEILEFYLNKVYFGDGLYGVEAASLGYFGKHAADVDVAEAALLAGLVKSPSTYAPTVSSSRALARRNVVLQTMRDARMIDRRTYDSALRSRVRLSDALRHGEGFGAYFKEEVRKQLVDQFGWERVYQGGLKVYTTLDLDMQKAAEVEVARAIAEIERQQARRSNRPPATSNPLQAALVSLDPQTGEVRALVGGRDFDQSTFDRATQARRQPGSAFKPFVYAAALEKGYGPSTLIQGLSEPILTRQGVWIPEDEHLVGDAITMRAAIRTSSNRAAVRMLQVVGIPATVEYAARLGLGSVPSVPSLALGSGEVTLMSMTSAFGAFANRGVLAVPTLIKRVQTADGEVLYETAPRSERAISEATAFLMTNMLADVVNAGTAWDARRVGFTLPAAGKTGTTNDYHDAWFVGYTPKLVTGVWVGYDQPRAIIANGYAAQLAVPLWGRFMATVTRDDKPEWFDPPASVTAVTICRLSGKLATDACRGTHPVTADGTVASGPMAYTEYFARGTEPIDFCPLHQYTASPLKVARGVTGLSDTVPPPPPVAAPLPVPEETVAVVREEPPRVEEAPPPPKRRGFWARVFGVGKNKKDKDESGNVRKEGK